jgi:hypothetical protein
VALQVPAGRIPDGGRELREEAARAGLVGGTEVVVFGFVAFEVGGEKLVDGDSAESSTTKLAGVEDGEVESVEDGEADQEIFRRVAQDSHGGWSAGIS